MFHEKCRRMMDKVCYIKKEKETSQCEKCSLHILILEGSAFAHLLYHPIMFPAFPRDPVILIRNQIIQQPCFRYHEPWAALDGAQEALGTPAGDGVGRVAGEAGNLLHGEYVWGVGQLLFQMAAEEQAADDLVVESAGQGYGRRFALGIVLVPPAGRSIMLRLSHTAAQIGGHVCLGNLVASGTLAGVDAGHKPALQQIQRSAGADVAGNAEVVAAHGIGIGCQERVDLLCQPVLCSGLFVHGRILL